MELRLIASFVALFIGVCSAVPLQQWNSEEITKCSRQCTSPQNFNYQAGKTYVYNYESFTKLHLENDDGPTVKVSAKAEISVVDNCELALQLRRVEIEGPADKNEIKRSLEAEPLLFAFDDGKIESICPSTAEKRWALNVKKGILSALQVSLKSLSGSQVVREKDVLGDCDTSYVVESQSSAGIVISKTKDVSTCAQRHKAIAAFFPRGYLSPETAIQSLPILSNEYACRIVVAKNIVQRSECQDKRSALPLSWSQSAAHIETSLKLHFDSVKNGIAQPSGQNTRREHLLYARNPTTGHSDERQVIDQLRSICVLVSNEIKPEVPAKFTELVASLRHLPDDATRRIHETLKKGEICASSKLMDIWADALIMDSSESSVKIIADQIKNKEISGARANYLLTLMAFANRPTKGAVKALLPLLEQEDAPRQALLGVSALIRNLIDDDEHENIAESQEVKQAIESLIKIVRKEKNSRQQKAIVAIKALKNIGALNGKAVEVLIEIAKEKNNKSNALRVAAIAALKEKADLEEVNRAVHEILRNEDNQPEIRIAAYKVAIEKPTRENIQEIISILKKESNKQVGSFISSHLENLQESSCPHAKATRELLAQETIPSHRFPTDIRKFSRNFELSHHLERFNLGAVVDADLIYDQSFAPRSVRVNVTTPLFGKAINLFEFGLRQVGLEEELESVFGPQGTFAKKDASEMFSAVAGLFREDESENEIRSNNRYRRAAYRQAKAGHRDQADDLELSAFLNIDGKTLAYFDLKDVDESSTDMSQVIDALTSKAQKAVESLKEDRAFSFVFLNAEHDIPSANGLPIRVALNGSVVLGYKGSDNAVWPSIAVDLSTKMHFDAQASQPGLRLVQRISSAPAVKVALESKNSRPVKITVSLPKDKMNLFTYESEVKVIEANNRERELKSGPVRRVEGCTSSFDKVLGVEFCSKIVTPKPFFSPRTPMLPLNGPWALELTLQKTDKAMSGWEWSLELPPKGAQETNVYRASFNTPGSRVNREVSAELQMSTPNDGSKAARLRLRSPFKAIDATASHKWNNAEAHTKAEVTIDSRDKYSVEVGMAKDQRGKKIEWKPVLKIQVPRAQPIQLGGTIIVDQGRKQQVAFDLHSTQNTKQFLKGSVVSEGAVGVSSDFRLASDLQGDLGLVSFKIFGTTEKQADKVFSSDLKLEYARPNSRKHMAKLVAKFQNLSAGQLKKGNSFIELQMSQAPKNNFHLSWNTQAKANEHLENEVALAWQDNFRNPENKIRVFQLSKFTGLRDGRTMTTDNVFSVEIAPLKINYEVKAAGHVEKSETPKFKIEIDGVNKNKPSDAASVQFEYQHLVKSPLKLSMDALLRIPSREFVYSDKLEEVAPNEFHGKTNFQWEANKKATLDYTYRVKNDARKTHHEFEAELKTPSMTYGTHHQALLRLSPSEWELKSKLNHERANVWDVQSLLSKSGKSSLSLTTKHLTSKFEATPYESTRAASLEVVGKTFPLNHKSDVQLGRDALVVSSKTIYNEKPILSLNLNGAKRGMSRLNIDSAIFSARLDGNPSSTPKTASFEIKTKHNNGVHKTTIAAHDDMIEIKSKTESRGSQVANLNAVLSKNALSSIKLEVPQMSGVAESNFYGRQKHAKLEVNGKRSAYNHKSEVSTDGQTIKITSVTKKASTPIAAFESQLGDKSFARLTTQRFRSNVEVDTESRRHSAKFQLADTTNNWEHHSELSGNKNDFAFTSKTEQQAREIAAIEGNYNNRASSLKVRGERGHAAFDFVAGKKGEFEVSATPYYHKTIVAQEPSAFTVTMKTERNNKKIASLESRISKSEKSLVKVDSPIYAATFEVDPSQRVKNVKLNINGKSYNLRHASEANFEPRQSFKLMSSTERNGRKVLTLNADLSKSRPSNVIVEGADWKAAVDAALHQRSAKKVTIRADSESNQIHHESNMEWQPKQIKFSSKTTRRGEDLLALDSQMSHDERSFAEVASKPFDGKFEYEPKQAAKWNFNLKPQNIEHSARVNFDQQALNIVSSTKRASRSIVDIDSSLSYRQKSHLKVKTSPVDAMLEITPAGQQKTARWEVTARNARIEHNGQMEVTHRALALKSSTKKNSRAFLDIDSKLSREEPSHLTVKTQNLDAALEGDFYGRVKSAKLDTKCKVTNMNAHHDFSYQPRTAFNFNSNGKRSGDELWDVQGAIKRDQSSLKVRSVPADVSFDVQPAKSAKWELKMKADKINHNAAINWDSDKFEAQSKTVRKSKNIADLKARISRSDMSNFEMSLPSLSAKLEAKPFGKSIKSAKMNIGGHSWTHDSAAEYVPRRSFAFTTENKKNNRAVFNVESKIVRDGKSYVKTISTVGDALFELDPSASTKTAKFVANSPQYSHVSNVAYEPREKFDFESATDSKGDNIFKIKSRVARSADSYLDVDSRAFAAIASHKPNQRVKVVDIKITGKSYPIEHQSSYTWEPRKSYNFDSQTKMSGRNVATIKSTISPNGLSKFDLTMEKGNGVFEVQPFDSLKTAKLNLKSHDFAHESTVSVDARNSLSFNSKTTKRGQNQATIDSNISRNRRSHVQVDTPAYNSRFEVNPWEQSKTAKLTIRSRQHALNHISEIAVDPIKFALHSKTEKRGAVVAQLDAQLARHERSHFDLKSYLTDASGHFEPARRAVNLEIRGKEIPIVHETNFALNDAEASLNTRTNWDELPVFALDSKLNRQNYDTQVAADNQHFKGNFAVLGPKVNFEYKGKARNARHLLGAAALDAPKNGFNAELQWDARDPESKVQVAASARGPVRGDRKSRAEVNVKYGTKTSTSISSEMTDDLFRGPHDVEINIRQANKPATQIKLHHEIGQGAIACTAKLFENGEEKIRIENTGRYNSNSNSASINADLTVKTVAPYTYNQYDGFNMAFEHRHNKRSVGFDSNSQVKGSIGSRSKPFVAKAVTFFENSRSNGKATVSLSAQTPLYDFSEQAIELQSKWGDNKIELDATAEQKGKKITANAHAQAIRGRVSGSAELKSDYHKVATGKVDFAVDDKSVALTVDANNARKVSLNGAVIYKNTEDIEANIDAKSAWTPAYSAHLKSKKFADRIVFEAVAKKEARDIFAAKAVATKQSKGWNGKATIAHDGSELAQLVAESSESRNEYSYSATAKAASFEPLKVSYKLYQDAQEIKPEVVVCKQRECATVSGSYIKRDDRRAIDRSLNAVAKWNSNEARLDWTVATKNNFVNKLSASLNGKAVGFDLEKVNSGANKSNYKAALQLPERLVQFEAVKEMRSGEYRYTAELQGDALREPQDKLTIQIAHRDTSSRSKRSIKSQISAAHPAWKRPLSASATFESADKINAEAVLDFNSDSSKKVTLAAAIDHKSANKTIQITAQTQDGKLNAQAKAHFARDGDKSTQGLQWFWTDRRMQRKEGMYFFEVDSSDNKINFFSNNPIYNVAAHGNYAVQGNKLTVNLDAKLDEEERKIEMSFDAKKAPCAEFNIKKSDAEPIARWQGCIDAEGKNVLRLTSESFDGAEKSTDASLVFDKSHGRLFRAAINWNPELIGEMAEKVEQAMKLGSRKYDLGFAELNKEAKHKYDHLTAQWQRDIAAPITESLLKEFDELSREMEPMTKHVNLDKVSRATRDYAVAFADSVTPDFSSMPQKLDLAIRKLTKLVKENTDRKSAAYKLAYTYERQGPAAAAKLAVKLLQENAKRAQQVVSKASGDYIAFLQRVVPTKWAKQIAAAANKGSEAVFNNDISNKIAQLMADSTDATAEALGQALKAAVEKLNAAAGKALTNNDVKEILKLLKEIIEEIRRELKSVDSQNIARLTKDALRFIATPEAWSSHGRVITFNPSEGEIVVEVRAPFDVRRLRSSWNRPNISQQYSSFADKITNLRSHLMAREWSAPFSAEAMLVGGQHFVTFDNKFYDFAGADCTYLLARDTKRSKFAVSARYGGVDRDGRTKKTIIVTVEGQTFEINNLEQTVKMAGREVDLPLQIGSAATVYRRGNSIVVESKHGLTVVAQLQRDIVSVALSGWQFGKTEGLFGSYDYESSNDYRTPQNAVARDAAELAKSWALEGTCRQNNFARGEEASPSSSQYDACHRQFVAETSPLRAGFAVVEPEEYFKLCLRHAKASSRYSSADVALCTVSATYVNDVRRAGINLAMPTKCLSCADGQNFGARSKHVVGYSANSKKADVLFVVEEHECNKELVKDIAAIARSIEAEASSAVGSIKFGVIGFGGQQEAGEPHVHTARARSLFDRKDIVLATEKIQLRRRSNVNAQVDAFEAIAFAADSHFRPGASKSIVLLSCSATKESQTHLDYSDVQRMLLSEGITLHVVGDKAIELRSSATKQRGIFAADARTVFRAKDLSQQRLEGQSDLRPLLALPKDVIVSLAQESRGSYFTTAAANAEESQGSGLSKTWKSLFSRRLAAGMEPIAAQHCECVLDEQELHGKTVCRPVKIARPASFKSY